MNATEQFAAAEANLAANPVNSHGFSNAESFDIFPEFDRKSGVSFAEHKKAGTAAVVEAFLATGYGPKPAAGHRRKGGYEAFATINAYGAATIYISTIQGHQAWACGADGYLAPADMPAR